MTNSKIRNFFETLRSIKDLHMYSSTVNDRLNALGVYLNIQNFKGAFIREGRLIKRGVYIKMNKFRKEKVTFSMFQL